MKKLSHLITDLFIYFFFKQISAFIFKISKSGLTFSNPILNITPVQEHRSVIANFGKGGKYCLSATSVK